MKRSAVLIAFLMLAAGACTTTSPPLSGPVPRVSVSAGQFHSCALKSDRTVACWGENSDGRLGDGGRTSRGFASAVVGLGEVTAVSAGQFHTCALKVDTTVACWGKDLYGELGGGGAVGDAMAPRAVVGLTGVKSVVASYVFTCAVKSDTTVACWGDNTYGQLGTGTSGGTYGADFSASPQDVVGLTGATAIAAGTLHTCALKSDHTVACWGYNGYGQLGDGTTTDAATPQAVVGLTDAVALAAGGTKTCAVKSDLSLVCWGGIPSTVTTPQIVNGVGSVTAVTALVDNAVCALKTDRTVACWGYNRYGQLGDGTFSQAVDYTPRPVVGLNDVTSLSGGDAHACAAKSDGTAFCWGYNPYGQLGNGVANYPGYNTPQQVKALGIFQG